LHSYSTLGYIPQNGDGGGESVSRALDFAYADRSVAAAYLHLIRDEKYVHGDESVKEHLRRDAQSLIERSERGLKVGFSPEHGLMIPHGSRGRFDPLAWGNGFTEGIYLSLKCQQ
jgi:hypothetical protein